MPRTAGKALPAFAWIALAIALAVGLIFGTSLAATANIIRGENFTEFRSALPTKIYDIKGRLITEFFADEKREPVSIRELPPHLIGAVLTREDGDFYRHRGFTLSSIARAAIGKIIGRNLGGGSTITQQLAGTLYADRTDISLRRKLVELWWALQLERRYTKDEILEMYLNRMIMGAGVYGVEAASRYFFGHPAREATPAESAILAIQLSSPARYDPFRNPNIARTRSRQILDQMVARGVVGREEAIRSFDSFWDSFDYTRVSAGAYFMRDDKAPWFSEYVRRQLEDMLYGSLDLYSDGFSVYTTLDLDQQAAADAYMKRGIERADAGFRRSRSQRFAEAERKFTPIVELMGLAFDLKPLFVSESKNENAAHEYFRRTLNPTIDATALLFGLSDLKALTNAGSARLKSEMEKSVVEGALITIENDTGYITAMVGGSKYDLSNQLIRATQGSIMPGSTFKPLYYSAGIDSGAITEGTMIQDAPTVFVNEDGTPYIPMNFLGEWNGPVLAWRALSKSMNMPSVKILEMTGFDAAIERAAALMGITDPAEIRRTFPRVYPLGLGIIGTTPLQMARAYAVFANSGREVTPIAIRSVEDRFGNVILEPEKDARAAQSRNGSGRQVVSTRNAAIMTDMLKRTVQSGTLAGTTNSGEIFRQVAADGSGYTIPAAGKTGTTVNWADAWTVGFTPYVTTAIWFGFDRPGNSLGVDQTGATVAGAIWAGYMRDIHMGLPYRNFAAPPVGVVEATVCAVSGQKPTQWCDEGTVRLLYYEGSQPVESCGIHKDRTQSSIDLLNQITGGQISIGGDQTTPTTVAKPDPSIRIDIPGFSF